MEFLTTNVHYNYCTLGYFLNTQRLLGIKGIDLYAMPPHLWITHLEQEDVTGLSRKIACYGLRVGALTPEQHTGRYSLCTLDDDRWHHSLEYFSRCMAAAAELGAALVCLHPSGSLRDDPGQVYYETVRRLNELAGQAQSFGIRLAIGSLTSSVHSHFQTLSQLRRLLEGCAHPNLYAVLDTLCAGLNGESAGDWFDIFGSRIGYVRLCDGRPGPTRMVWGQGVLPLGHILDELRCWDYKGPVGLAVDTPFYFNDPAEVDRRNIQAVSAALGGVNL